MDRTPEPELTEKLSLLDDLRQSERRAVGALVASALGHVIGTPLHVIAGRASLIRANPTPESAVENARRIEEQVERLAQRIRALIEYLTVPDSAIDRWPVERVVDEALTLCRPLARGRQVEVSLKSELPDATVDGWSSLLVLTSLLSMATRTASVGNAVELSVSPKVQGSVLFELQVPGMNLPESRLDRLDPPENWNRDGADRLQVLCLCFAVARRRGGHVELGKNEHGSTTVRFRCAEA